MNTLAVQCQAIRLEDKKLSKGYSSNYENGTDKKVGLGKTLNIQSMPEIMLRKRELLLSSVGNISLIFY